MAAVTTPQQLTGRSLLGKVALALRSRSRRDGRPGAGAAVAAFIGDHIGTAVALAAGDVGMFHIGPAQGWTGVMVAVILLEFKVRR